MSNLNSLLKSSADGWKNMQNEGARISSKWGKTGLLEGLDNEIDKNAMALILENQAKQLVTEASATDQGGGSFTSGNGGQWAGVALPLVRKVFGSLSTKEFMSVQPMNLPSGLVFFLDFQYGDTKQLNFGGSDTVYGANASMYGDTNPAAGADANGGLYGAGRFGYSINQFSASATTTVSTSSWESLNYDAEKSASVAAGGFTSVSIPAASLVRPDTKGIRAFALASGSAMTSGTAAKLLPQYTEYDGTNIFFIFEGAVGSADIPTAGTTSTVLYNQQPVDNNRGDFEDAAGAGRPNANSTSADALAIPEINVKLKSEAIVAKTRKLKAQWTPEFAQDLNAYQSLDAEAELTSIMSEYISLEIDLENLDMLIQDASAADEYWSAQNNRSLNSGKTGFDDLGFFNTQGQWFQTLGTKMQKVSNKIHQKTLRGGANFVVVSPTVATVLESIPGFASNSDGDTSKGSYAFGIQKAGQLNSRYTVYKNPYMTENVILMGYRGSQFLETGAVFSPYIPLIMTPLVYDPDTFTPRKGLLTRYAKKMIRPEFYGRIFISDLASI
tara:strand:+ start:1023 stop:2693 length:1671 start_codon:yes stop_codon:yes gene_type:complete